MLHTDLPANREERREALRVLLNKLGAMKQLKAACCSLLHLHYQLPAYRVATDAELLDHDNLFRYADGWRSVYVTLRVRRATTIEEIGFIQCDDLVVGRPFIWCGHEHLPDEL